MSPAATSSQPSTDVSRVSLKELTLRSHDLTLLASSSNYDLTSAADRLQSTYDLQRLFLQIVRIFEPDLFIEAGAKDAGISRRARTFLPQARVVAFEANPFTHRRFGAMHDNAAVGVEYLHLALSETAGTVQFNLLAEADGTPAADGNGSLLRHEAPPNGFVEVNVEAVTLDGFFGDSFTQCALWIDVEGASKQVLSGAESVLDRASVLIIELEDRAFWGQEWLRPEIYSYLYDRGLVPVARDFQARYLYNVVFVRESLLDTDRLRWALALHASFADRPVRLAAPEPARPAAAAPPARAPGAVPASAAPGTGPSASLAGELYGAVRQVLRDRRARRNA
ncbi:methyltransferase, FkbM family [Pedococcus dokdonensis]|uniref:Methyltransferase, FkbM family n=1 Tax=Pedococcus dokdonensis TaxID=443156 RepID=A0A1H0TH60_9MICO|nr:FkbM family methyltransferase [Pedococcus dokdonensis]SDP53402.1 methyltransferase, FkbM family [Pedococcus dokdonensis]